MHKGTHEFNLNQTRHLGFSLQDLTNISKNFATILDQEENSLISESQVSSTQNCWEHKH